MTILSLMDEWGLTRSIYCFCGKVESVVLREAVVKVVLWFN